MQSKEENTIDTLRHEIQSAPQWGLLPWGLESFIPLSRRVLDKLFPILGRPQLGVRGRAGGGATLDS